MNNEINYDRTDTLIRSNADRTNQLIRSNMRVDVLATIDELYQYLLGNVTIEAATAATRELTHKLNAQS
jgi:hypothetical protein